MRASAPTQVTDATPALQVVNCSGRGISALLMKQGGAQALYPQSPAAGSLGDIRVGDSLESVLAKWGPPTQTEGQNAACVLTKWNVVVQWDPTGKRVTQIALWITD